ncbi:uncharacterized protein LOC130668377 [Microplitis mediator]|uniref:uncharacterized protein LOC130668377 n=1 Tax=Microplitis mediator TaxID=375433 RepID=UPI0025527653|nr:uncharacterized protein LOC130668377 [Microplitis mediator]
MERYLFEDVMISPNTPVYYLESLDADNAKVTTQLNVFKATQAYKYYNDPKNYQNNTFLLNILLIFDNIEENPEFDETRHTNKILQDFSIVAKSFNQLNDPKIKLHIAGVIKWKHVDTTAFTMWSETSSGRIYYYNADSTLDRLSSWLYENAATFSGINYDMFIFLSNKRLYESNDELWYELTYYQKENVDCTNRRNASNQLGGLLYFGGENVDLNAVQMIAFAFGVRSDSDPGCESDSEVIDHYYMHIESDEIQATFRHWSECSQADFKEIVDNEYYECLKMPGYEDLILGPNTYIYSIDPPGNEYVRIISDLNRFEATPTYNYYRKPDVDLSNTYVINILLIYDWSYNAINEDRNIVLDSILKKLNIVAVNFNKLEDFKLKLRISGIVLPPRPDIFNVPETQKTPQRGQPCYRSSGTLRYLSEWLRENGEQFENPSFDFFLFVTSKILCDDKTDKKLDTGAVQKYNCNNPSTLVKSSGALVQYDASFSLHVTQLIAQRFGVKEDDLLQCGSGHIMDYQTIENSLTTVTTQSWSNCSQLAFQSIPSAPEYSCYKMPAFKPDSEENDY